MKNISVKYSRDYSYDIRDNRAEGYLDYNKQYIKKVINGINFDIIDSDMEEVVQIKIYDICTYDGELTDDFKRYIFTHINYKYKYLHNFMHKANLNKIKLYNPIFKSNIFFIDKFNVSRDLVVYLNIVENILQSERREEMQIVFNKFCFNIDKETENNIVNAGYICVEDFYIKNITR